MTLGAVWTGIVVISLIFAMVNGRAAEVTSAALDGAGQAVTLALTMTGALCLWSGICRLLEVSGISRYISRALGPLLKRLFPEARADSGVLNSISACVTANLLGIGNAATPLGIEAVGRMKQLSKTPDTASDGMCRFIVLCTASIQLIPSTVAVLRASLGAEAPFDILPAVWVTSVCSVAAGLLMAFFLGRLSKSPAESAGALR